EDCRRVRRNPPQAEGRKGSPVDVFRQDRPESVLAWLMSTKHRSAPCFLISFVQISLASSVIAALRTFETGQFFSASAANRAKVPSSRLGTWARKVSAERLMRKPCPSGSRVIADSVLSSVGLKP